MFFLFFFLSAKTESAKSCTCIHLHSARLFSGPLNPWCQLLKATRCTEVHWRSNLKTTKNTPCNPLTWQWFYKEQSQCVLHLLYKVPWVHASTPTGQISSKEMETVEFWGERAHEIEILSFNPRCWPRHNTPEAPWCLNANRRAPRWRPIGHRLLIIGLAASRGAFQSSLGLIVGKKSD